MGQKTSPIGFRLVRNKNWSSSWYANKYEFGFFLHEDLNIVKFLRKKPSFAGTSQILIKRLSDKIEVTIHTARPGLVIGKKGSEIEILREELGKLTNREVWIAVEEIKRPDLDAKLVAEGISRQIEKRMAYRRVLKRAIQSAMDVGAAGIRVQISGRVGGAEIARTEWYKEGTVSLHTLRDDIDYGTARAETTYGAIGVKVWISKAQRVR